MSSADKQAFEKELRAYVGRATGPPAIARDPVNEAMIRQWCDAMGETHPAYLDADAASAGIHGGIVAPPTMLQAWTMGGWEMHEGFDEPRDEQQRLHKFLSDHGYTGVLGTNTEESYARYLHPGDVVSAETVIEEISEEKATGAGIGYFITTKTRFVDQAGEELGTMSFRVLKFKPPEGQQSAAQAEGEAAVAQKPTRIKPPMGPDNGWWWKRVADEEILPLQRCTGCEKLRHPPRPMCDACGSTDFDSIAASGRGKIHTFTVIHHPQFPGYEYPLISVLVDLEEGERIISILTDCKPADCQIGMPVEMVLQVDDDGFKLPYFRPAG